MQKRVEWGLVSLLLALVLAGCSRLAPSVIPETAVASTRTALPTATSVPESTATPTPVPTVSVEPTPTAVEPAQVKVLNWQREGGIAGFCDGVTVFADGGIRVTSCRSREAKTGRLSGAQVDRVLAWVARLASFDRVQSDGAVADGMAVRLTFAGQGTQAASEADVQAMLEFAASLLPPPQAPASVVLQTGVRYPLASEDVPVVAGPGADYPQIGQLVDGQMAWVTGTSADGAWWRVICPDETVGNCWLPADRELVIPATPPGAWPVHMFPIGASVDYPAGWFHEPNAYADRLICWYPPACADQNSSDQSLTPHPTAARGIF